MVDYLAVRIIDQFLPADIVRIAVLGDSTDTGSIEVASFAEKEGVGVVRPPLATDLFPQHLCKIAVARRRGLHCQAVIDKSTKKAVGVAAELIPVIDFTSYALAKAVLFRLNFVSS